MKILQLFFGPTNEQTLIYLFFLSFIIFSDKRSLFFFLLNLCIENECFLNHIEMFYVCKKCKCNVCCILNWYDICCCKLILESIKNIDLFFFCVFFLIIIFLKATIIYSIINCSRLVIHYSSNDFVFVYIFLCIFFIIMYNYYKHTKICEATTIEKCSATTFY